MLTMCQALGEALKTQGKQIQTASLRRDPNTVQGDIGTETGPVATCASLENSREPCCG